MRDKQPDPHKRSNHSKTDMDNIRQRRRRRMTRQSLMGMARTWNPPPKRT